METAHLFIVLVTVPSQEAADSISETILEERLAACVNVIPGLKSRFHWEGNIDSASELLLVIKTKNTLYSDLESRIQEIHPYDTPEIVALPATAVFEKYNDWVMTETR